MEREDPLATLSGHIVICNCNEKVPGIVQYLRAARGPDLAIVVLVQDRGLWNDNPSWHPADGVVFTVDGCPTVEADLRRVRIADAGAAVILADPRQGKLADARSTLVAVAIERHNPQVHTVMELVSSGSRLQICAREVNEIVCMGDITEKLMAQSCITPGVDRVFQHLLSNAPDTSQVFLTPVPDGFAGLTYRELARRAVVADAPFVICGFTRNNEDGRRIVVNPCAGVEPGRDSQLEQGDKLVVISASPPQLEPYLSAAEGTS
jgi:hypothetical protein